MKIALDYDGTVTEDPILWKTFVGFAKARGHDVRIVTFRAKEEITTDLKDFADHCGIPIITTARSWKHEFCVGMGWVPDIWIDDSPALINHPDGIWEQEKLDEWKQTISDRLVEKRESPRDRKYLAKAVRDYVGDI